MLIVLHSDLRERRGCRLYDPFHSVRWQISQTPRLQLVYQGLHRSGKFLADISLGSRSRCILKSLYRLSQSQSSYSKINVKRSATLKALQRSAAMLECAAPKFNFRDYFISC